MVGHRVTGSDPERARRKARKLLQSLRFFNHFLRALERDGLVGEQLNALILLIVVVSRLLRHPLSLFVRGRSSTGKNWLVKRVLRLMPKDTFREISSTSEAAWNYLEDDFRHRVVYLQERNHESGKVHPIRLLISENKLVRLVTKWVGGRRTTKRYVTRGPVASISTTTKDDLEIDDLTRNLSIFTDEGSDQTRRIVKQYTKDVIGLSKAELAVWHAVQDLLKQIATTKIVFPDWFEAVGDRVFTGDVTVRRYYPAFIEACRTVCLIRSFRSRLGRSPLEVEFADFAIAALVFDNAFVESLHRQNGSEEATRRLVQALSDRKGRGVEAKDLAYELGISIDSAYAKLRRAEKAGVIQRANKPERQNRKLFVTTSRPRFIPDPEELFRELNVDETVRFVHPVTGEWVVYGKNRN